MSAQEHLPLSDDAGARIAEMAESARKRFTQRFGGQPFDSFCWDLGPILVRPTTATAKFLYFTRYGSVEPEDTLPENVSVVLKSWCVLDLVAASTLYNRLIAARRLLAAMESRGIDLASFRWESLCFEDLRRAEAFMQSFSGCRGKPLSIGSIYTSVARVNGLAEFLYHRGICRWIGYSAQTPHPREIERATLQGREVAAEKKMPTETAIAALGEIYHTLTTARPGTVDPMDLFVVSVVAIQALTGLRLGELLTLPYACERTAGPLGGERKYGLVYYVEKTLRSTPKPDIRWISPTAEPIVRSCIARLKRLTASARKRAWVLERDPSRVPLPPELARKEWLSREEVEGLLNTADHTLHGNRFNLRLKPVTRKRRKYYRPADVAAYLLQEREERLWTIDFKDGTRQPLSGTLLIAFRNFFHPHRGTNTLLVDAVRAHTIMHFLSGATYSPSIFERFGKREPSVDGREGPVCRITSHQFRHWLNTIAMEGGMDAHLITRYFARQNPRDTEAYLHWSPQDTGAYVRDEIKSGRVFGPVSETYWSLPEGEREEFLHGQVPTGHFTPFGLCVHSFDIEPCPLHLNCLKDCGSYCRTQGDAKERAAIETLLHRSEALLRMAENAAARGQAYARTWIDHHQAIVAGCRRALAIDAGSDPAPPTGALLRPFGNRPSRMLPIHPSTPS